MSITDRTVIDRLPQVADVVTEAATDALDVFGDVDLAAAAEGVGDFAIEGLTVVSEGTTVATRSFLGVIRRHPKASVGIAAAVIGLIMAVALTRRQRHPQQTSQRNNP